MSNGFYKEEGTIPEPEVREPVQTRAAKKKAVKKRPLTCESCGAFENGICTSPQMDMNGSGHKKALILAEAPGPTEDEKGKQLEGMAGQIVKDSLAARNLSLGRDFKRINAINCYLGKLKNGDFRKPTKHQIDCCREVKVNPAITQAKPTSIWLMGNIAIESFYQGRTKLKVTALQGRMIPDKKTGAWVFPMFHPSFVLRGQNDENLAAIWERTMDKAVVNLDRAPPTFPDPEEFIECITGFDVVVSRLATILDWTDLVVIDYETSGLKPHAPGHVIHSMSIAYRLEVDADPHCISFPISYPDHFSADQEATIKGLVVDILKCERIKKVAHNLKFEDMWSKVILGVTPKPWEHDTIIAAHILDNCQGITGLKTQAWLIWGIEDYDADFAQYKSAFLTPEERKAKVKPSNNHFNRVGDMPLDSLLLYGGYDGIIEFWLYERQVKQLRHNTKLTAAYDLFHEGTLAFCDMLERGVPIDEEHFEITTEIYSKKITDVERAIFASPEAKLFEEAMGRPIDLNSFPDLGHLFYDLLGLDPPKFTDGGKPSVDKEAIGKLDLEFARLVIQRRGWVKIAGTYADQIMRESVGGILYPSINLNIPVTYRSSMSAPNLQNTPIREEEPKKAIRMGIVAEPGCSLLETDFGGIEVCGIQWYSQDKVLGDYLWTPGADMHRDQAQNIFDLRPAEWDQLDPKYTSMLRFFIKNLWVFPEFYGSWYRTCAENIWDTCHMLEIGDGEGTTVEQWLGLTYPQFEARMREYENEFWETFKGVREYQNSIGKEYRKNGYIESFLGFRFGGWMTRNNLYNYKVQSTAFHLLLWCLIRLNNMRKARGWQSRILWQIHDSIVWNLHPEERVAIVAACKHIMTRVAPAHFPWINTPIQVEPEITDINGTFYDLKEYKEDAYESA